MQRLVGKSVEVKVINFDILNGHQEFVYRGEVFAVNSDLIGIHKMVLKSDYIGQDSAKPPTWFNTTSHAFISVSKI
jgi:hypothetical protein